MRRGIASIGRMLRTQDNNSSSNGEGARVDSSSNSNNHDDDKDGGKCKGMDVFWGKVEQQRWHR